MGSPNFQWPGASTRGDGSTGGSGGSGGGIPDYASLMASDPFYLQLKADLAAQGVSDAATRKLFRNRAIGQFGILPEFGALDQGLLGGDLQSDLDPNLGSIIEQGNTAGVTTKARMQQLHEDRVRSIKNALAARGRHRGGGLGYHLGREAKEYDVANYDATQKLVDYLAGVQAAYLASERGRQQEMRSGASDAYGRSLQLAGLMGGGYAGGAGGGGGGGFGIQWTANPDQAYRNIAAAGYTPEQVAAAINSTMQANGWGQYTSSGGLEDPLIKEEGQIHTAPDGRRFIRVKVGHEGGISGTEDIYLPPPGSQQQQQPQAAPAPAQAPPPVTNVAPNRALPPVVSPGRIVRTRGVT